MENGKIEEKTWFLAKFNDGQKRRIEFKLDNEMVLVWGGYFVDTLMKSAEEYLSGKRILCVDGGSKLCITNIDEWVKFVLANRYDITKELRKEEESHPVTGETNSEEAKELLFEKTKKQNERICDCGKTNTDIGKYTECTKCGRRC